MRRALAVLLLLGHLAGAARAAPEDGLAADAAALVGSVLVNGRAYAYLRELADRHGPRLTGSPVLEGAVEWSLATLRAAGVTETRREEYTIPNRWTRGPASARMTVPFARELHVMPTAWAPAMPHGVAAAPLVILRSLKPEALDGKGLRGRLVALDLQRIFADEGFARFTKRVAAAQEVFVKAQVAGLIWGGRSPNQLTRPGSRSMDGSAARLPAVDMGMEDFKLLARLADEGPVEVELRNESRVDGPTQVANVIGELRGRELPGEVVMVGAHLDAWDLGTGAQDNGSGVAEVLEAARAIAAMPRPPRRTIRFVLWTGEEQGCLGARAWVKAHRAELGGVVALLNTDSGAGAPRGWETSGRADVRDAVAPLVSRLLAGFGMETSAGLACDSDHAVFAVQGVPVLNLLVDDSHYEEIHHLPADTLDKVNAGGLAAGAAAVAVTAWALAEQPARPGRLLSLAEVDQMLQAEGEASCADLRK